MDFQDLHAFFHVATEGSFSKASARLRVAQSALSRRVARLEYVLGVGLLQRHGRGVRLTEQGLALIERAEGLMNELEQIERDILVLAEVPTGRVCIAMPPMVSQVLGPPVVTECRRRFPRIEIELREAFSDVIHDWISEGLVDLGLLYSSGRESDLQMESLLDEPLLLLAPGQRNPAELKLVDGLVDLVDLKDVPLILPRRPNSMRMVVDRLAEQHGFSLNIVMEVDGVNATKGFVASGLGYTIFSSNGIHDPFNSLVLSAYQFRQKPTWELALAQQPRARRSRALVETQRLIREQILALLKDGRWQGDIMAGLMH